MKIKNKLFKTGRRLLSVLLCLVMLATTFFIFDPSILKLNVFATANRTEKIPSTEGSTPLYFYVPEIIYLTPTTGSSSSFQYELDCKLDSSNNVVPNGTYSSIGANNSIYFSYANASNIKLSYAWYSGSSGTLTINGVTTTPSSTATSLTTKITSGTAAYSSGTTQYILWTVEFVDKW